MLTEKQRAALKAEAEKAGIDPAALIREAEALADGASGDESADPKAAEPGKPAATDKPLYMYHLPFVTVNEVRTIWLGLDAIPGGDENAAKYAAANAGIPAKQGSTE